LTKAVTYRDSDSAVISISEEKFDVKNNEINYLMNTPIEIGAYEKNHHLLLLIKIGPDEDPYIYPMPFDPVSPYNLVTIDKWIESRFIVVSFIEGKTELTFRGIRIQGIPNEVRDYVVNNWIDCIKLGSGYTLKYLNFLQSTLQIDPLDLWKMGKHFGVLED
jgi:hypothetical protein